jgi:hypothetical protein
MYNLITWTIKILNDNKSHNNKLFGSYWWHTFGPSTSVLQILGKGISVREVRTEGSRDSGETPTVEDKSSSIYLL